MRGDRAWAAQSALRDAQARMNGVSASIPVDGLTPTLNGGRPSRAQPW
jgi:hypothetical protein